MISAFDPFKIGIGRSSSHTVGPMRAAAMFARSLRDDEHLGQVCGVRAELFGSLGAASVWLLPTGQRLDVKSSDQPPG